jgi:hypothetical protein
VKLMLNKRGKFDVHAVSDINVNGKDTLTW